MYKFNGMIYKSKCDYYTNFLLDLALEGTRSINSSKKCLVSIDYVSGIVVRSGDTMVSKTSEHNG